MPASLPAFPLRRAFAAGLRGPRGFFILMARRPYPRPRLRDTVAANAAYLKAMGANATEIDAIHQRAQQYLPKQRKKSSAAQVPTSQGAGEPTISPATVADLEAPVVRAVAELLAKHPRVIFAVRANSGRMEYQTAEGRRAPVVFYRLLRHSKDDMTITDFWGFLRVTNRIVPCAELQVDLDRIIPFAIEAKRPSWKEPREPREFRQAAFITLIRYLGGVGGFVRSADEAAAILA